MKYDERTCKVNMDTGCVELRLRDGRMISIDCTGVEDALDVTMAQRTELDYLMPMPVNMDCSARFLLPAPTFWDTKDAMDCIRELGISMAKLTILHATP